MPLHNLPDLRSGSAVFADVNVLVYGMRGASPECVDFLLRCNSGDLTVNTSANVLADVSHRLMILEASDAQGRLLKASYLKRHPNLIPALTRWNTQMASLLRLPFHIAHLGEGDIRALPTLTATHRMLTKDALILRHMSTLGLTALATADGDFTGTGVDVYAPTDL